MNELLRLSLVKTIMNICPKRIRYRFTKFFYNYNSNSIKGINLVVEYWHNNLKFLLNTKEFIGWNIFFHNNYEFATNNLIEEYIKPDYYVIEAGANNGSETIIIGNILKRGNGKVFAFEPAPVPFKHLLINIIHNELEEVIIPFDIMLGEEESYVDFYLMADFESNQGMSSKYEFSKSTKIIKKRQTTLDEFINREKIEKLDFLKMDIQGSEIDLINGGINTLKKYRPIIFTEASNSELKRSGNSIRDLYNKIGSLNYNIFYIDSTGLTLISDLDQIKEGNWLAIPK